MPTLCIDPDMDIWIVQTHTDSNILHSYMQYILHLTELNYIASLLNHIVSDE